MPEREGVGSSRRHSLGQEPRAGHDGQLQLAQSGRDERHSAGREVRYAARPQALTEVTSWVEQVGARWDERLESLRNTLGAEDTSG